jgi:hypothetical protein
VAETLCQGDYHSCIITECEVPSANEIVNRETYTTGVFTWSSGTKQDSLLKLDTEVM